MGANKNFVVQCASCKKVRQDGSWVEEETGNTEISHGICPDCVIKLYPEYAQSKGLF